MLTLHNEELLYLLNQSGLISASDLADKGAQAEALQVGEKHLHELSLDEDDATLQTVTQPTAVLHATRIQTGKPDEDIWFFYTPSQTVLAQKTAANQYELTTVSGETAVLEQLQHFLPLQPVSSDLTYRIIVDQEEFENLRDLASAWEEVPSLTTLEADGLDLIAAKDLFDSAVEPQWRGILDLMRLDGTGILDRHTIRVLQGQEAAWLVRPYPTDEQKVLLETAQAGELQKALADSWRLMTVA